MLSLSPFYLSIAFYVIHTCIIHVYVPLVVSSGYKPSCCFQREGLKALSIIFWLTDIDLAVPYDSFFFKYQFC